MGDIDWMESAVCRQTDLELWFPDRENPAGLIRTINRARNICRSCPVQIECLDYALAAIEIVDSAIADWKITLTDTVADNASSGLYLLGNQPMKVGALPLGSLGMQMYNNGQLVSTGAGASCLGHPLRAAYWLACTMAIRGQGLCAGQVILSGALGPMVPVVERDIVVADLGPLGSVRCRFVA